MERTYTKDTLQNVGKKVRLFGWVAVRRDHGKLIFLDLRDATGVVQIVINPKVAPTAHKAAQDLRGEFVVEILGTVNKRPENLVNHDLPTGTVEVEATDIKILNPAKVLPFELADTKKVNEETRLKYRYLDLRNQKMTQNLKLRHKVLLFMRNWLSERGFLEIETPILTKSTPEGARDYLVPSRIHPGKFYALPQAPQQYKQLLMVAGVEKYFQFPKCFRDEDTRGDRQPEFTQLDLEMSFVEREDVMKLNEELLIAIVKANCPEKKIQDIPFPRLSYQEAMKEYGTDRPDLRKDKNDPQLLAFCWIIDFPFFEKTEEGGWIFTHNPFSAPKAEFMDDLLNERNIPNILALQYDVALNGLEIGGGSIRNNRPEALKAVFKIMGYGEDEIKQKFGHMLEAFKYGTPPHGGIAWGMDRFLMILSNEPNIREVIAFPKTGDAFDPMMVSPDTVDPKQLRDLRIKVEIPKKN